MATLVLSTLGRAVGGPVGGAIGGLLGRQLDRALFAPRPRVGPRLAEPRVTTAAYATPLPLLFGVTRVSGTLLWSTEPAPAALAAHGKGGRGGGAGYTASFAVALSARAIVDVRRIWADGQLLRGAAGDWKSATGFRLHHGTEDQLPDPLIAAHEADAPAFRGIAYAVFEQLQLADFGGRVPMLSFEVIADAAPVRVGDVARAIGAGAIVGAGPDATVDGYAASGDSVAGAVAPLASLTGGWFVAVPGGVALADRCDTTLVLDDPIARETLRRPIETAPRTVTVAHYDAARDYQVGAQHARRGGAGWREETVELPATLSAARAAALARDTLRRAGRARVSRTVTLDARALAARPGAAVRLDEEAAAWRVTRARYEQHAVTLELAALDDAPSETAPADSGAARRAPDVAVGATLLQLAELPPLDDAVPTVEGVTVFAAGTAPGWRRVALLASDDAGASWTAAGDSAPAAVIGALAAPLARGPGTLVDRAGTIELLLAHDEMVLESCAPRALDRGANLALVGDELMQFAAALQLAPRRWRLSTLLRARRGSAAAAWPAGARFVLVERATAVTVAPPGARAGDTLRVLAAGVGDVAPVRADVALDGRALAPPSPVHLRARALADGATLLTWVRRSRHGWRWDEAPVPLGEERELYVVTLDDSRRVTVVQPRLLLPAGHGVRRVAVRQQGTLALSRAAELML
ncbi:phage tail protein [Sphingomonas yunnanensis]|uniref:GTA baseplate fiber-binding domain-containing protein n=1 Tax=Sphingomonas yunnanensis TaxID=310400 RepID=UPI001CA76F79|nr:phage tail protein [Sphingomonas yunnanensis]MBY9062766.1 phage tail protein [Sphingomonas yunnanensis]